MNLCFLKKITIGLLMFTAGSFSCPAQDLIANQAPTDRRVRSVDSVALQRLLDMQTYEHEADIYDSWDNTKAHPYASALIPDSFRIDLRGFVMPTTSTKVTSRYGYRPSFRRMHKGLDIKVYTGDTIVSAFDGKVRVVRYDAGGYGYYVVVRHKNGLETIYGHLSKQLVVADQEVKAGEPIGLGGNTGRSFGSHLHFETRLLGAAINPELLFDFPAQDVTANFFTFRKADYLPAASSSSANNGRRMASTSKKGGSRYYKVRKGDT
ncbi:MAG: M23 family metallopeptidase, partial [Alloprevotella sp.]|nr:M23 family metallopeptidase [Alloprevotella sp.]